jgi:UDP-N-acetylglucosamine acyltransferase
MTSNIHPSAVIHSSAIVESGAVVGEGTEIGPFTVIGPRVVLGKRNRVASHVVIEGRTTFGDENRVYQFASIGAAPQDLKFKGEESELRIGNGNMIREYVTLQPGTAQGGMKSVIGDKNLFMAGSHVAHDTIVGNGNVLANYACLAGHVVVGNRTTLGGLVGIHQFVRIGDMAILAAGSMVAQDVPPFCMGQGDRCSLIGLNKIGLQRNGASAADVSRLRKLYRHLFWGSGKFSARLEEASAEAEGFALGQQLVEFLKVPSQRGVIGARMGRAKGASSDDSASP